MCGLAQHPSVGIAHTVDVRASLTQDAVLDQQEAQTAVLCAVQPGSASENEDGKFGGHGQWYDRTGTPSHGRSAANIVILCMAMNCSRSGICDIRGVSPAKPAEQVEIKKKEAEAAYGTASHRMNDSTPTGSTQAVFQSFWAFSLNAEWCFNFFPPSPRWCSMLPSGQNQ